MYSGKNIILWSDMWSGRWWKNVQIKTNDLLNVQHWADQIYVYIVISLSFSLIHTHINTSTHAHTHWKFNGHFLFGQMMLNLKKKKRKKKLRKTAAHGSWSGHCIVLVSVNHIHVLVEWHWWLLWLMSVKRPGAFLFPTSRGESYSFKLLNLSSTQRKVLRDE